MNYRIISPDEYKTVPWKNGKGTTTELFVKYQLRITDYIFRISIAGVSSNGPFSDFSGYDRVLMMLEGNGIRLEHSDGTVNEIRSYSDIARFSGDLYTHAKLKNGPIKDFNVMTLKEVCSSEVIAINGEAVISENEGELLIYCAGDMTEVESTGAKETINHNHLLHITKIKSDSIRINGDAIAVRIMYK